MFIKIKLSLECARYFIVPSLVNSFNHPSVTCAAKYICFDSIVKMHKIQKNINFIH